MPYDSNLDKKLFSKAAEMEAGKIVVSVYTYQFVLMCIMGLVTGKSRMVMSNSAEVVSQPSFDTVQVIADVPSDTPVTDPFDAMVAMDGMADVQLMVPTAVEDKTVVWPEQRVASPVMAGANGFGLTTISGVPDITSEHPSLYPITTNVVVLVNEPVGNVSEDPEPKMELPIIELLLLLMS